MDISVTPYERTVLDAYNAALAYRQTISRSADSLQPTRLLEIDSYLAPEPPPPALLDELDDLAQYRHSLAAAEIAFKLGIGELLADYLLMRALGADNLAVRDTAFRRLAVTALEKLLVGVRAGTTKPEDIPEVQAAYQYRVRMLEALHHLMLYSSRMDMGLSTDWLAVRRQIRDLQLA